MTTKAGMNIPITVPFIGSEEADAVRQVLASGWLLQGAKVEEFENLGRAVVGSKYAKACSSCTSGLHMSLLACGIGPGDRVLVPAYTFVATANAAEFCGAVPVLVDIDLFTFNISASSVARVLSQKANRRARALVPVHLFGLCADMSGLMRVASAEDLIVVEDAACALGSYGPAGNAGNVGHTGVFSFHPRKSVTTGEGGLVTTNDKKVADRVHALRDFGFTVTNLERHQSKATLMPKVEVLGWNFRMTDIQGAIGVEQMKKWKMILAGKQRVAERYNLELANLPWLLTPRVPDGYNHTYQSYACLVGGYQYPLSIKERVTHADRWGEVRNRLMAHLKENGIATRQGTHAVHTLDYYAKKYGYKPTDFINTYAADEMCITIPLFPQMTEDEQAYVIEKIRGFKL